MAQLPPHGCVKVVLHVYPAQRLFFIYCTMHLRFAIGLRARGAGRAVRCVPRPATHPQLPRGSALAPPGRRWVESRRDDAPREAERQRPRGAA